ncbi:MAG: hypothetical protein ALAOOOJD_00453 [bacterium]|nr:hypothetical protein [bacterium]
MMEAKSKSSIVKFSACSDCWTTYCQLTICQGHFANSRPAWPPVPAVLAVSTAAAESFGAVAFSVSRVRLRASNNTTARSLGNCAHSASSNLRCLAWVSRTSTSQSLRMKDSVRVVVVVNIATVTAPHFKMP